MLGHSYCPSVQTNSPPNKMRQQCKNRAIHGGVPFWLLPAFNSWRSPIISRMCNTLSWNGQRDTATVGPFCEFGLQNDMIRAKSTHGRRRRIKEREVLFSTLYVLLDMASARGLSTWRMRTTRPCGNGEKVQSLRPVFNRTLEPDLKQLKPYYDNLFAEFLSNELTR